MNILFTSVGRRSYLVQYFKDLMGRTGQIHAANSSAISPAFLIADKTVVTPLIYSPDYIPFLLDYCKENHIDLLISLFDIDLPVLSRSKAEFEKIGTQIIVSDPEVIDICNDKWNTYTYLSDHHFSVPRTYLSLEEALCALEKNEISYPVIVKPRWGMGSISVCEADNPEELKIFYDKVKRNICQTYLKYESAEHMEQSVIIQEKLSGQEYGLDVINDLEKNYINTSVKKKIAMRSGETDCAVTVDDPELKELGKRLSQTMKHIANLDVDVFKAANKYYILEMNARFGGGYPFSHMAGVNLPAAILQWAAHQDVKKDLLTETAGIMCQKDIALVQLPYAAEN